MLSRIPVIEMDSGYYLAIFSWHSERGDQIALVLMPCPHQSADPLRPRYCVLPSSRMTHIARLSQQADGDLWKEVYLFHQPPPGIDFTHARDNALLNAISVTLSPPFRFRPVQRFLKENDRFHVVEVSQHLSTWTGHPRMKLVFKETILGESFSIHLGRCVVAGDPSSAPLGPHWAYLEFPTRAVETPSSSSSRSATPVPPHSCERDHICDWPLHHKLFLPPKKLFSREYDRFRLVFKTCPLNPTDTLIMHLVVQKVVHEYTPTPRRRSLDSGSSSSIGSRFARGPFDTSDADIDDGPADLIDLWS